MKTQYFVVCTDKHGKWKWNTVCHEDSRVVWKKVKSMDKEWTEEEDELKMYVR